jgi:predicted amidohydrolase
MKFALVEFEPVNNKPELNTQKMIEIINETEEGTDLIVFPEMAFTGFTMNKELHSFQDTELVIQKSRSKNTAVLFGWIEKYSNNYYNSSTFFDPKTHRTLNYRKRKLFTYRGEEKYYTPGNSSIHYEFKDHTISHLICYDLRFPELFRETKGVEIFIVIACWPKSRKDHWKALLKARAIENQAFVIGVNRSGIGEIGEEYGHLSIAYDYMGKEMKLTRVSQIKYLEIDDNFFKSLHKWREKFPVLRK